MAAPTTLSKFEGHPRLRLEVKVEGGSKVTFDFDLKSRWKTFEGLESWSKGLAPLLKNLPKITFESILKFKPKEGFDRSMRKNDRRKNKTVFSLPAPGWQSRKKKERQTNIIFNRKSVGEGLVRRPCGESVVRPCPASFFDFCCAGTVNPAPETGRCVIPITVGTLGCLVPMNPHFRAANPRLFYRSFTVG